MSSHSGTLTTKARLGNTLDAATIADWIPTCSRPAPRSRHCIASPADGGAYPELCRHVADTYDGDASRIWKRRRHADTVAATWRPCLVRRGEGQDPARRPRQAIRRALRAGRRRRPRSAMTNRSVADMGSAEERLAVRASKKAQKAAGKAKDE